jgi:flagellar hook-associated protein 2
MNSALYYVRLPLYNLQDQRSELEVKTSVFTDLKEKLETLEDALELLGGTDSSALGTKSVTSSLEGVATGTATSSAMAGSYSVFVSQLARSHTVVSHRYTQDGTALSDAFAGTQTFSITVDGDTYDVSVDIGAGETDQTVLANIASEISAASDGAVQGSMLVDTPTTAKLSVKSAATGTEGEMTFTDTDGLLAALGVTSASEATDTAGGYVYADLGGNELDALLSIDGINVVSSSNTVEDVVEGLTINLLAEQDAGEAPAVITVSIDSETIKADIEEFLSAYNEAYEYLVAKTRVDGDTYERAVLAGDYPYVSLRTGMRQAMSSLVGDSSQSYRALSQIGITSSRSGSFVVSDADELVEALETDLESVENLFTSEDGVISTLASLIEGYTEAGGTIHNSKEAITSKMDIVDDRIERQEYYIGVREEELRKQYAALQEALYAADMQNSITASFSGMFGE